MKKFSFKNLKLAQKLTFLAIGVLGLLTILVIVYIVNTSLDSANKQNEVLAKGQSKSIIEKIDRNFYERFGDVQAFAYNRLAIEMASTDTVSPQSQSFINTMVSYYVLYDLMVITNKEGKVVAANTVDKAGKTIQSEFLVGKDYANAEWFRSCTSGSGPEGGAWFSDFMVNKDVAQIYEYGGYGMAFAAAIKNDAGEVVGTWYNFANWGEVTQGIRKEAESQLRQSIPDAFVMLTNSSNQVIDGDDEKMYLSTSVSAGDLQAGANYSYLGKDINSDDYLVGAATGTGAYIYKGKNWNVLTFLPLAKFNLAYLVDNLLTFIICVILIFAAVSFGFLAFAKGISKNINVVKESIQHLAKGVLVEVPANDSKDEIGEMTLAVQSLLAGLKDTSDFAKQIGSGNLNVEFNPLSEEDVLGKSLLDMRANLQNVKEADQKRAWGTEGLAKFGDILRSNNEGLSVLADSIISNLVKYLGGNQGGLFVVNDTNPNDKHLELVACYAWNKKKHINMRIEAGEGMVGQAWQENDVLYITDVPENFVKITSGLGDANPSCFLIVPLTVNDETFGVIEIASFAAIEDYQMDFVKKLAESIASTLSAAKVNERTKVLLEQSQQQTEEMRAQEEEMRQNMEEMQATQEEMERKEGEVQKILQDARDKEAEMQNLVDELRKKLG
ncbi:MAG: GAF domain-containing protein [Bacteroidetes bacterium]|nr:GAF domain-containing protein [Bacteroidota bacterium]